MQVVVSLAQPSLAALARAAATAGGDLVEARLDLLDHEPTPDDVARFVRESARPLLVTVRSKAEGGAFRGTEPARIALLLAALDNGAAVDVEAACADANRVLDHARARGGRVVLSSHDLSGTPEAPEILARLRDAARRGAWVGKVACTFRSSQDAAAALAACLDARREGLAYAVMAVNDATLRLLGPLLGQALVYARPDDAHATAPGQPTVGELARAAARLPAPTTATRPVFLLGHPVRHSASPALQNAAFRAAGVDATFIAADVPPDSVGAAVRALPALRALGANVTMPHKEAVLPHCDEVSKEAQAARAANTLVVREGRVLGYNTDGAGALAALHEAGVATRGILAVVLGAGGTARAVASALLSDGATVVFANRTHERAVVLAAELGARAVQLESLSPLLASANLVVNATPVGLADDRLPIPAGWLLPSFAVLDCPYRPGGTPLAHRARAAGYAAVVPGDAMLLHQGALAFTLWTGKPAPLEAMRAALAAHLEGPA